MLLTKGIFSDMNYIVMDIPVSNINIVLWVLDCARNMNVKDSALAFKILWKAYKNKFYIIIYID